ncbi:MAG: flagellar protein FlaG [Candidatus Brocadiae bacterium]|nr:flagellar protein FlaG [Candidatus Brocadiia bacterium]
MITGLPPVPTSIPIPAPEPVREAPAVRLPVQEPPKDAPAPEPPPAADAPPRGTVALSIGIHDATGQVFLQLVDARTREILRSVPPQEVLEFRAALSRSLGLFLDTVA